ncbi:MAG: hypothetical protein ACXIVQ_11215 [Acidimicrobiales bacterium]
MAVRSVPRTAAVLLVAAPPTVWALHLGLAYWLVPVSCRAGTTLPIHLATGVALLALAAVVVAGRRVGRAGSVHLLAMDGVELEHRTPSGLARLAVLLAYYFAVVVVATGLVAVFQRPCA